MANVLIVDDNEDICRVLARLVRASGHTAHVVYGGQAAIDYLQAHQPDLMILDVMMPVVDGIDVLRAVRGNPQTSAVPVVMFTAVGEGELRESAMREGATGYWVKGNLDLNRIDQELSGYLARTV